jgi:hypothetical protein
MFVWSREDQLVTLAHVVQMENTNVYRFCERSEERDRFEDLGIDGRVKCVGLKSVYWIRLVHDRGLWWVLWTR